MRFRSPIVLIGLVVIALVLVVAGVYIQVSPALHNPDHPVSYKAIACWAAAVASLIAASFARPRAEE